MQGRSLPLQLHPRTVRDLDRRLRPAIDVARGLGFPGATREFWDWCRAVGLVRKSGVNAFSAGDVKEALARTGWYCRFSGKGAC